MMGLTEKQADLLRFIAGFQAARGYSPTFDEMADGLGLKSKGCVARLADGLEERKAIRRLPDRARAIEVLVPVSIPRAPDGGALRLVTAAEMARGAQ